MFRLDKDVFENAGGSGCSDSSYPVVTSTSCDRQFVEDDELSDLYFDPTDLSKKMCLLVTAKEAALACPICHSTNWSLVPVDNIAQISEEWRWALPRA